MKEYNIRFRLAEASPKIIIKLCFHIGKPKINSLVRPIFKFFPTDYAIVSQNSFGLKMDIRWIPNMPAYSKRCPNLPRFFKIWDIFTEKWKKILYLKYCFLGYSGPKTHFKHIFFYSIFQWVCSKILKNGGNLDHSLVIISFNQVVEVRLRWETEKNFPKNHRKNNVFKMCFRT